jgi:hypothetical protein
MSMTQKTFCPVDFHFEWTDKWYSWDRSAASKDALKARNDYAKAQREMGKRVVNFTFANQLIREGGIGSGHPDVEFCVSVYGCNVYG